VSTDRIGEDRISERDDLDQLDDDDTLVEDPDVRRAKTLFALLIVALVSVMTVIVVLLFRPEGQVFIERWPNGYPRTRTTYVGAQNPEGRVRHGRHQAWHMTGQLAEEGRFEGGERVGEWRYWDAQGNPLPAPPAD
jgi:hypothetical protein